MSRRSSFITRAVLIAGVAMLSVFIPTDILIALTVAVITAIAAFFLVAYTAERIA